MLDQGMLQASRIPQQVVARNFEGAAEQGAQEALVAMRLSIPDVSILFRREDQDQDISLVCISNAFSAYLVQLVLGGLLGHYLKTKDQQRISLALHSLQVEDLYQSWGPSFQYLATSWTTSSRKYSLLKESRSLEQEFTWSSGDSVPFLSDLPSKDLIQISYVQTKQVCTLPLPAPLSDELGRYLLP